MNEQFLRLLNAKAGENVTLATNSTPPSMCCIPFDDKGNPISLRFRQNIYDFLRFDNVDRESNPRALFVRDDGDDSVHRIEINFYGEIPPYFTLVERTNFDMMPPGGIDDYCGMWVAETQCKVQRI